MTAFGQNLSRLRSQRGLTITRLAALSGTGAATISRAEHGTGDVLMSNAQRIADALGVPLAEMVTVPQEES